MTVQQDAQVLVVGAGPAGSTSAVHLARAGVDVLVLEKESFPRDKVCGDSLSPRGVRQLLRMGVDITTPGWKRIRGVRLHHSGREAVVDWPALGTLPDFGRTRSRHDFDQLLARHAEAVGARLRVNTKVTGMVTDRSGRVVGITARAKDSAETVTYRAPLVIADDGASSRTAIAADRQRDTRAPMATAARRYFRTSGPADDDHFQIWSDLRCARNRRQLLGYGWIFPLADGRVNVGLGALAHSRHGRTDLRATFDQWLGRLPAHWNLREDTADTPLRSAALPMGLNRRPQYHQGLLLIGDSAGMISPWTGEGIAQAMEASKIAAETVALALTRPPGPRREQALRHYPREINRRWGRHYRLGNTAAEQIFSPFRLQPAAQPARDDQPHRHQPARQDAQHVSDRGLFQPRAFMGLSSGLRPGDELAQARTNPTAARRTPCLIAELPCGGGGGAGVAFRVG